MQQLLAVQRELPPGSVERGEQQRRRARRAEQAEHPRDRLGVDPAAQRRRAASRSGSASRRSCGCWSASRRRPATAPVGGSASWKPKCGPQAWSTTSGIAGVVGDLGQRRRCRRPSRSTSARPRTRRARPAPPAARAASASGVTQCVIPSSSSYSGTTKLGSPPLSTRPSTTDACELRWTTTRVPERRERQAQRVVALGRAVGEEPACGRRRTPRRPSPPPARTASATGRRRSRGFSCGTSAASASTPIALTHAGVGARAALVARDVVARRARGTRTRRPRRGTAPPAARARARRPRAAPPTPPRRRRASRLAGAAHGLTPRCGSSRA